MAKAGSSISKTAMWILMGLLIIGLAGFGAANLNGNVRSIGTAGDKTISVDSYARLLQSELSAYSRNQGEAVSFAQARAVGLDRAVLQRVVRDRALDHETAQLGLSIGDETLRDQIVDIPAFQGANGAFDRESYRFALRNSGQTESEFETSLREEAARSLLQGAILGGVEMPAAYAETLVNYVSEKRDFTWTLLDEDSLTTPIATPDDATLQAYYEANQDRFMLPPAKEITYILVSPDALLAEVEVPEEEIRAAFDDRSAEFNQPERRLVERLPFADQEAADQAAAALEVGGTTFETLVEERGLSLIDVDMGDVGRLELDAAGEAVFSAEPGEVVGPLPSSLGPALFRMNAVLPARSTSYEDAREGLREQLASARAIRAVEPLARDLDDRLAGGEPLEDLAQADEVELGTITWSADTTDGIAAYDGFRRAAAALQDGDFAQIETLEDGGVFALRLDDSLPERPNPFAEAKPEVEAAWRAEQTVQALQTQAETALEALNNGSTFEEAGLEAVTQTGLTRNDRVTNAPAALLARVFALEIGQAELVEGQGTVALVRLDTITPASEDPQAAALQAQVAAQINQSLAQNLFSIYAADVVRRAEPQIDQRALDAVHVNFP